MVPAQVLDANPVRDQYQVQDWEIKPCGGLHPYRVKILCVLEQNHISRNFFVAHTDFTTYIRLHLALRFGVH